MQMISFEKSTNSSTGVNHFFIGDLSHAINDTVHGSFIQKANHYEIFYLKEGAGKITVNLQKNEMDPGKFYLINPGQLHRIELDESAEGFTISVSRDFFHMADNQLTFITMLQTYKGLGNILIMQPDDSNLSATEETICWMQKAMHADHTLRSGLLLSLFKIFLLYLSKSNTGVPVQHYGSSESRIALSFVQLVTKHFIEKKLVADYASELCVTRSYLNKVVKKVSGFTASQIIQQYIVQEAKKQAIGSESSMKQIAYSLGFDDSAHFSKFFKNNCGINFTNYKKEIVHLI